MQNAKSNSLHARLRAEARREANNPSFQVECRRAASPFAMGTVYNAVSVRTAEGERYLIRIGGRDLTVNPKAFDRVGEAA